MDILLAAFDDQFASLHRRSVALAAEAPSKLLFQRAVNDAEQIMKLTVGENIIRSAAFVEMTCGGITTRLWDDPFEWTLPEELSTSLRITDYLKEVEATRQKAFGFFKTDDDLRRSIPAPRDLRPIGAIIIDTLSRAEHYQGRAFALYQSMSGTKAAVR